MITRRAMLLATLIRPHKRRRRPPVTMPWSNQGVSLIVIQAGGTGFTGLFVYSGAPAAGNLIASIAASGGTDPFGNTYVAGVTSYVPSSVLTELVNGGVFFGSLNPSTQIVTDGKVQGIDVTTGGTSQPALEILSPDAVGGLATAAGLLLVGESVDSTILPYIQTLGPLVATAPGSALGIGSAEVWNALSMINGWANTGGSDVTGQYRMVASPPNSVEVIGCIHETAKTSNTFATLPSGYRPASVQGFGAHVSVATGGTAVATTAGIQCDASGNLSVIGYAAGTSALTVFFHGFISLDA